MDPSLKALSGLALHLATGDKWLASYMSCAFLHALENKSQFVG